jgi:hypothetical protein
LNCSQARALLAEYRELKKRQVDTTELDNHLKSCSECRQVLAEQTHIGARIRALPSIEPSPEAHERLMQALAAEHVQYMRHSILTTATPPPAFLESYVKEQARKAPSTETLTAFSAAETGPLPIIQMPRRHPQLQHLNPFTIVGIAAAFLMVLLMGGLTSLLLLTHNGLSGVGDTASINNFVQVSRTDYTTTTPYTHVVSAVNNRNSIYYTAYGDSNTGWMLEEFDTQSNFSIPLLTSESKSPLIVLGSQQNWLVWLQLDGIKSVTVNTKHSHTTEQERTWSLHALYLNSADQTSTGQISISPPAPITLLKDTFNLTTAPSWVSNPVQGIWFTQNGLLVAALDAKGNSHLWQFKLDPKKTLPPTALASASNGYILTSPTANSDGTSIYWSEEWQTSDGVLHSNIWTQQTNVIPPTNHGKGLPSTQVNQSQFTSDGMSFHPQLVNDTLFYLSTNPSVATGGTQTTINSTATATPMATASTTPATATPAASPTAQSQTSTTNLDTALPAPPADASIQGTLLAVYPEATQPTAMDTAGLDSVPQGGTRFILWQNSVKGMEMYDVATRTPVTVKDVVPRNANFLTVNGDSAVWTVNPDSNNSNSASNTVLQGPTVTFSTFSWPSKLPIK